MYVITDERCTGYHSSGHPERPARIIRTRERLLAQTELPLTWSAPAAVEEDWILRAHTADMLARVKAGEIYDADTPAHPGIYEHAGRSVGGAVAAMRLALKGEQAFSLLRPPGHHATRQESMGFCYLNSIAIAALEALASGVKKVAVYDFDVHHGNGTEDILRHEPRAFFASIHQFPCYPGTGSGPVGVNCFNYPVAPRTPRLEYRKVLERALEQLVAQRPEVIAVSAGFDAYARDPLAQETLEAEDYHWLGGRLRALGIPVFSVLEGGYSGDLPELVLAYLKGLAGA